MFSSAAGEICSKANDSLLEEVIASLPLNIFSNTEAQQLTQHAFSGYEIDKAINLKSDGEILFDGSFLCDYKDYRQVKLIEVKDDLYTFEETVTKTRVELIEPPKNMTYIGLINNAEPIEDNVKKGIPVKCTVSVSKNIYSHNIKEYALNLEKFFNKLREKGNLYISWDNENKILSYTKDTQRTENEYTFDGTTTYPGQLKKETKRDLKNKTTIEAVFDEGSKAIPNKVHESLEFNISPSKYTEE